MTAETEVSPWLQRDETRLRGFQELMQRRVQRILLVASLYDSFILTEDGHLNEALLRQFIDLNLSHNPDLMRVPSIDKAVDLVKAGQRLDLIITSVKIGDSDAAALAQALRAAGAAVPIVALAFDNRELTDFIGRHDPLPVDRIFLWQGDVRILLAIVKYIEDIWNVEHDTGVKGAPAIIVVEDNIRFYSSFLPVIYTELMNHTHHLISEGLNLSQKMLRMRARPKVLLCDNFEDAWAYFEAYEEQILGVISDIEFPRGGHVDPRAGLELASRVCKERSDVRLVLQSSRPENEALAKEYGASFLLKGSPVLLHQLRSILVERFGFGDFVFRLPSGRQVDSAQNLRDLIRKLKTVPAESIAYHAERNHFSNWIKARTEFELAGRLRPRKVSDFRDLEHLRSHLLQAIGDYRRDRNRVVVADFDRNTFESTLSITRIGGGSLGGKARGLAFVNRLLSDSAISSEFPDMDIRVPPSVVLGTDVFDQFLAENHLDDFALSQHTDEETRRRFLGSPFPRQALFDLKAFVAQIDYPLAVRSSGLLEDSSTQAFAGVYQTYMLPNNHPDHDVRLHELISAVKRVYASTFSGQAKSFLNMTPFRLEEEKMGVIIQQVFGRPRGSRFYPDFAGVARSYNFYPKAPLAADDGIVAVALGMGKSVVDGDPALRFSPKYPRHLVTFSSVEDALANSQREFYAVDLSGESGGSPVDEGGLRRFALKVAEEDGSLAPLASTYSHDNRAIYDGISRPGVRLISFASVLKHETFPLARLLDALLEIGSAGTSSPVEIEFAVNLRGENDKPEFGFLQMRPMALSRELEELRIGDVDDGDLVVRSSSVMGNGRVDDLVDVVVVDAGRFDRLQGVAAARDIARFNATLQRDNVPYLLIGVGRWGSSDPYLGIPVGWHQIAGARVIVEAGYRDFRVSPSQGTHFFQNLSSCNVGYFTVNPEAGEGFVDWDWLVEQPVVASTEWVRHVRLEAPLVVKMSGQDGEGVILKPGREKRPAEG